MTDGGDPLPLGEGGLVLGRLRAVREQSEGQVIVLVAICMFVLIGMTGFALDIGHAYFVQRELQRSADAAALAAALDLPNAAAARETAIAYSGEAGKKNATTSVNTTTSTVTPKCLNLGLVKPFGCSATDSPPTYNTIQVRQNARVPTFFARVLGINNIDVHATATACSPCEAGPPIDIMLVLDRTGSMCQTYSPAAGKPVDDIGECKDLQNAKSGMTRFLELMDPESTSVGLAVFPPAASPTSPCDPPEPQGDAFPRNSNRNPYYDIWHANTRTYTPITGYLLVPLSNDYLTTSSTGRPIMNLASPLGHAIDCVKTNGSTSYVDAISAAQNELSTHGRDGSRQVIVFLSDGAANATPSDTPYPSLTPCRQGVAAAAMAKSFGTLIFSIGYDLDGGTAAPEQCKPIEDPVYTSYDAMGDIATSKAPDGTFYTKDDPGSLQSIFTSIAMDVSRLSSRLIADDAS